jgi:hypothetical protein
MQDTCPRCGKPVGEQQAACQECGAPLSAPSEPSADSARESFLKRHQQEGSSGKHNWWTRQPKTMKMGIIAGSVTLVALLVILPFWSSWFGSDHVRTLNLSQDTQYVELNLESLEYVSSPRDSSKVAARLVVWGGYSFDVSAVVSQGQDQYDLLEVYTTGSEAVRWVGTLYFNHFDIADASKIKVVLSMSGASREYVFEVPAK